MKKILVIGAGGQIGSELVLALRNKYSAEQVIASDVKEECPEIIKNGQYKQLDILNRDAVREYVISNEITEDEILQSIREHGRHSIGEIHSLILESDGNISVVSNEYKHHSFRRIKKRKNA